MVGVATIVHTIGSAPRRPGAALAVTPDGDVYGSVSGGCVEGAVYEMAIDAMQSGQVLTESFGVSDDQAFDAGLTCGGTLEILVEPISRRTFPDLDEVAQDITRGRPVAYATITSHQDEKRIGSRLTIRQNSHTGSSGAPELDRELVVRARELLKGGRTATSYCTLEIGIFPQPTVSAFIVAVLPPPRMLIFGATSFTDALSRQGALLGYDVVVCDARATFATSARFPFAKEVVVDWPHRYFQKLESCAEIRNSTVVCSLLHDPKFETPLLQLALRNPAVAYVGAMGSRQTHRDRVCRLKDAGVDDDALGKLSSPIGLDLRAESPEEVALSIAAEILSLQRGGSSRSLSATTGPVHGAVVEVPVVR